MKFIQLSLLLCILLLSACASTPQRPITLSDNFWSQQDTEKTVGIIMSQLPTVQLQLPGAGCLLCIAVASGANSDLSKHTKTLKYEGVRELKTVLKQRLEEQGIQAKVIKRALYVKGLPKNSSKTPNSTKKSFTKLANQHGVTHLLVIDINSIGMIRTYSSYVPTSDPKAVFSGSTYIVNASNNTYQSYKPINIYRSANDQWKEPPTFPGLTNAFYQAIEMGKETIISAYKKQEQKPVPESNKTPSTLENPEAPKATSQPANTPAAIEPSTDK